MRIAIGILLAASLAAVAQEQEKDGPTIGFEGQTLEPEESVAAGVPSGVMVNRVPPGSPAEATGLKRDDIVCELDGKPLTGYEELANRVSELGIGKDLKVTVARGKDRVPMTWKIQAYSESLTMVGARAPMIRADGWVGGEAPSLEKLKGRPVLLVLWSGAIQDAEQVEAMIRALHEAYSPKGLAVVPVHMVVAAAGQPIQPADEAVKYVEGKKFPMPVGHASGERFFLQGMTQISAPLVAGDYRVQKMPSVILIDKDRKIAARWEGSEVGSGDAVKVKIEELMK